MRKTRFVRGGVTVGVAAVLLLAVASAALAGTGRGGVFNLGVTNTINGYVTMLKGAYNGALLAVSNSSTTSSASAISATNASRSAAALRARNTGGGPAFEAIVPAGKAPLRVSAGAGKVNNLNVDRLDGMTASQFQNRVTGACPAGSSIASIAADGTVACGDTAGNATTADDADLLDGQDSSDFQGAYKRTIVVRPVGSDTENGAALREALAALTATEADPKLLKIEPGTYDIGTTPLAMKPNVDIEGSGPQITTITCACGGASYATNHTLKGANGADLRFIAVENTGGASMSIGIYNNAVTAEVSFVTVSATGATNSNTGVTNFSGAVEMSNVTAHASGWPFSTGVHNDSGAATSMNNVAVTSVVTEPPTEGGATGSSTGVSNHGSPAVRMTDVAVRATGHAGSYAVRNFTSNLMMRGVEATATGAGDNTAVFNDSSSPRMFDVVARATGGTGGAGIRNRSTSGTAGVPPASPTLSGVSAIASGGTGANYGIHNDANGTSTAVNPILMNVEAIGQGGAEAYGMRSFGTANSTGSSPQVIGSILAAKNATTNDGLYVAGTGKTTVVNSSIAAVGTGRSVWGLSTSTTQIRGSSLLGDVMNNGTMTLDASQVDNTVGNSGTMRIGGSMIGGVSAGGTYTCVASYTTSYTPLTCP